MKCDVCCEVLTFDKFRNKFPKKRIKSTCKKCLLKKRNSSPSYIEYQKKWRSGERGKELTREYQNRYDDKRLENKREEKRVKKELLTIERENKLKKKDST